jgi:TonB family protein
MLDLDLLLMSLIIHFASLLAGQTDIHPVPQGGVGEPNSASLVLELDRAIRVLERGIKEKWDTRDQYLAAFERTPNADSTNHSVASAKKYVECAINARLRIHQVWDEGSPIGIEAHRSIIELTKWRKNAAAELPLPPCQVRLPRKVKVSAGVAAGMLKTKVEPIYPSDVHISGTVVLHAVIDNRGRVELLSVVSGPAMLQQSALEAVRQWIFRPYRLNDVPVEVETTINVVFASSY